MGQKEAQMARILYCSNISFLVLCGGIFVLCSAGTSFKGIEIVIGFPFVIICIVLVYAMAKIKTLL